MLLFFTAKQKEVVQKKMETAFSNFVDIYKMWIITVCILYIVYIRDPRSDRTHTPTKNSYLEKCGQRLQRCCNTVQEHTK